MAHTTEERIPKGADFGSNTNLQANGPATFMNENRIPVGILGATGMVGQHFVKFLQNHPWFEITWMGASDRSAGKPYREATSWRLDGAMPAGVQHLEVHECKPVNAPRLMFSSMDASVATEIEREFAQGRPRGGLQFAQSSHGAGCSAADSRSESRSSEDHSAPAARCAAGRGRSPPIRIAPPWCWPWRWRR